MKSTPQKTNSNRKNAKKSTGPKSRKGKAAVALNGVCHGLRSTNPVLPGLEKEEDWESHRKAMIDQLAPVGAIEYAFAEKIALGFWRLGRSVTAESRLYSQIREEAFFSGLRDAAWREGYSKGNEPGELILDKLEEEAKTTARIDKNWGKMMEKDDGDPISHLCASEAIFYAVKDAEWDHFKDELSQDLSLAPATFGDVRMILEWLAVKLSTTPQKWMEFHAKKASAAALEAAKRLKRMVKKAELSQERVQFNSNTMQNISRYETTIHRALIKDLHELQRIQAMRLGIANAVPSAIDITEG